jgi:hypothetical protein
MSQNLTGSNSQENSSMSTSKGELKNISSQTSPQTAPQAGAEPYLRGRPLASPTQAVLFSGRNGLDFYELRLAIVRIPEVTVRLKEAQNIIDGMYAELRLNLTENTDIDSKNQSAVQNQLAARELPAVPDLISFVTSDDQYFFRNINLKTLVAAIVQIALVDRYLKAHGCPVYMAGPSKGESALAVVCGEIDFRSLVQNSAAFGALAALQKNIILSTTTSIGAETVKPGTTAASSADSVLGLNSPALAAPLTQTMAQHTTTHPVATPSSSSRSPLELVANAGLASAPMILAGISLAEFRLIRLTPQINSSLSHDIQVLVDNVMDMRKIISTLALEGVRQYINIGPQPCLRVNDIKMAAGSDEVSVIDSIEVDPMLSWFWTQAGTSGARATASFSN